MAKKVKRRPGMNYAKLVAETKEAIDNAEKFLKVAGRSSNQGLSLMAASTAKMLSKLRDELGQIYEMWWAEQQENKPSRKKRR